MINFKECTPDYKEKVIKEYLNILGIKQSIKDAIYMITKNSLYEVADYLYDNDPDFRTFVIMYKY